MNSFSRKLAAIGGLLLFGLVACMGGGGAGGGAGGPPGAEPSSGLSPVGGPVGASGQAAGPMPMPAPASVQREIILSKIYCTNIPGPMVECGGSPLSVPNSANLRLSVHAIPQASSPAIGTPVDFTANPDGSWVQMVTASGGQFIRLCLLREGGICKESVFLPVPPEGGTILGTDGIMHNLILDSDGNVIFSQRRDKAVRSRWSWRQLLISEAHAEEGAGTGFYLNMTTLVSNIDYSQLLHFIPPPQAKIKAANCSPTQRSEWGFPLVEQAEIIGNAAKIYRIQDGSQRELISIPGATRDDIRDLAYVKFKIGDTEFRYIAASVKGLVYLIRDSATPYIEYEFYFPPQFDVSQLISAGPALYVLLTPKPGGPAPSFPLYRIRQNVREGEMEAMCIPPPAVAGIQEVFSLDSEQYKLSAVFRTGEARYQVAVGSAELWSDITEFPLVPVFETDHPVETAILDLSYQRITIAVLDPIAKVLHTIVFPWGGEPEEAEVTTVSLETLLGESQVVYPRALAVDRVNRMLGFLDVQNNGSKVFNIAYSEAGEGIASLSSPTVTTYNLGMQTPSVLFYRDGHLECNNNGTIRRVDQLVSGE